MQTDKHETNEVNKGWQKDTELTGRSIPKDFGEVICKGEECQQMKSQRLFQVQHKRKYESLRSDRFLTCRYPVALYR